MDGGFSLYDTPGPAAAAGAGGEVEVGDDYDPEEAPPTVPAPFALPDEMQPERGEIREEFRDRFEGFLDRLFRSGKYKITRVASGLYGELYRVCDANDVTKCIALKPSCAYVDGKANSCERFRKRRLQDLSDVETQLIQTILSPVARSSSGRLRNVGSFAVFAREAKIGASLGSVSPNFVNTYGYMENDDGYANIFMEMIERWKPSPMALEYMRFGTDPVSVQESTTFSTLLEYVETISKLSKEKGVTFPYMEDIMVQIVDGIVRARKALPGFKHQDLHINNILLTNWHAPPPIYGGRYVLRPGSPRVVMIDFGLSTAGEEGGELRSAITIRRVGITSFDTDMYDLFRVADNLEIGHLVRRDLTVRQENAITANRFSREALKARAGLTQTREEVAQIPTRDARQNFRAKYEDVVVHYYWSEKHYEGAHPDATPVILGQRRGMHLLEAEQRSIASAQRDGHIYQLEDWYLATNLFRCLRFVPKGDRAYWGSPVPALRRLPGVVGGYFVSPDERAFQLVDGALQEAGVVVDGRPVRARRDRSAYMWWPRVFADQNFWDLGYELRYVVDDSRLLEN